MKQKPRQLLLCIAIPLAVGGISAWLTQGSMDTFEALNKPPLSPPGWLFPVVWTILFVLMGAAAVWNTVRRQLFLVDLLFQSIAVPVLLRLAHSPMVSDCSNHRAVLPHLPDSRVSDAPVLTLGHICRISELGDLSAELDGRPRQAPKKHHLPLFRQ